MSRASLLAELAAYRPADAREAAMCREIAALLRAQKLDAEVSGGRLAPCLPLETDARLPLVREFLRSAGLPVEANLRFFFQSRRPVLFGHG